MNLGRDSDDARVLADTGEGVFPDSWAGPWQAACKRIAEAGYGAAVYNAYRYNAPKIAELVGPELAIGLADRVSLIAIKASCRAAEILPAVAARVAVRLNRDRSEYAAWLQLMERLAYLAPESTAMVLERMDQLLSRLDVSRLEAWLLAGVRSAGSDAQRRRAFFSFDDPEAARWLDHESGSLVFSDISDQLKAYMIALWGQPVPLRESNAITTGQGRRRAGFGPGIAFIPSTFPGFIGAQAEALFQAVVAHIGAHLRYSGKPFPVAELKPLQVALISLIEDARVEQLAMRDMPGLHRLWAPFHTARAAGSVTAPSLMARLSRALIDPAFKDDNPWVRKAKAMFYRRQSEWENPLISREIGGLIGNDLGQMRIQFNARTYVTEPAYRDDNLGLWDFGDQEHPETLETELLFDAVDIEEQEEDDAAPPDREREEQLETEEADANRVNFSVEDEGGIPVARYPEYDYLTGRSRPEWTTLVEYAPSPGKASMIEQILETQADMVSRIQSLIRSARVSRPQKCYRQPEGEFLDLNASIEAMISRRVGETPDTRVFGRTERRGRDLSVQVLLDISESTSDRVVGSNARILDLEQQATALLAHAMAGLDDPFAIAAFCSNRREQVRYYRLKDFDKPYDRKAMANLAGLQSGYSTRLGAAMRHAAEALKRQQTHRRLLLVVTDGVPSDIDVTDSQYLVEDARHVIHLLAMEGIDVFCVGLDSGGDSYLSRIFGRRNVVQIDRLERLPEKLPMLYFRLTA